jgi:DNA repair protein RadC
VHNTSYAKLCITGDPAPSPEDLDITRRLREVGEVMGIRVLDHVVIGRDRYFSFSDKGMM